MKENKIIYLSIPYTWNPEESFRIANIVAAELMKKGFAVLSPISHSHVIAEHLEDLRLDHEFWMKQDLTLLSRCEELLCIVLGDEGIRLIEESKGCQQELDFAVKNGIRVRYRVFRNEEINLKDFEL